MVNRQTKKSLHFRFGIELLVVSNWSPFASTSTQEVARGFKKVGDPWPTRFKTISVIDGVT